MWVFNVSIHSFMSFSYKYNLQKCAFRFVGPQVIVCRGTAFVEGKLQVWITNVASNIQHGRSGPQARLCCRDPAVDMNHWCGESAGLTWKHLHTNKPRRRSNPHLSQLRLEALLASNLHLWSNALLDLPRPIATFKSNIFFPIAVCTGCIQTQHDILNVPPTQEPPLVL